MRVALSTVGQPLPEGDTRPVAGSPVSLREVGWPRHEPVQHASSSVATPSESGRRSVAASIPNRALKVLAGEADGLANLES
ncbi:hypothetical protein SGL43_01844 [Streptomyces globisporus]|uniref:Uncharacterized protein n=1 Tax=Streptomyces globisporus TaxID=1908 RepID=A0ABM9GU55_STRGL|nr:hypothetical protein SGL43_01844 [Streptomyces globisporus]